MTHVTQQISEAWRVLLRTIPAFGERVYPTGAVGWDERTYPMVSVNIDGTTVSTERTPAGYPRMQTRETSFVIAVHDLMTVGTDFAGRINELVVAVESLGPALNAAVAIEDCSILSTTGIQDQRQAEGGVHAAQALTFRVLYHTIEGRPDAFADPD